MNAALSTLSADALRARPKEQAEQFLKKLIDISGDDAMLFGAVGARRLNNIASVCKAAEKMMDDAELQPKLIDYKVLSLILDGASLEENQYLQHRWAAMLANAATDKSKVSHPRFPELLKHLSHSDALILNFISRLSQKQAATLIQEIRNQFFHLSDDDFEIAINNLTGLNLVEIFEPSLAVRLTALGGALLAACMNPPRSKQIELTRTFELGGRFDKLDVREEAYK